MAKKESRMAVLHLLMSVLAMTGLWASALAASKKAPDAESDAKRVWIKKSDGGITCESKDKAESLEAGQKALEDAKVTVFASRKQHDNKLRASVCGIPKGTENAFEVPASQLEKARSLGYQPHSQGGNALKSSKEN